MNADVIQTWLKRRKRSDAVMRQITAALAFMGGLVVVFFTFWFTYAIVWIALHGLDALGSLFFNHRLRLTHEWRLLISGVFLILLFIQHLWTSPWHWGEFPERDDYSPLAGHVLGPWALLMYPGASANMIASILLSGPRLVTGSWTLWREAAHLQALDVEVCSQLLTFLLSRPEVVPYDELRGAGWEEWLGQLRQLEGLVFLEKGLKLSSELRQELSNLYPT
jgi:hypothetical protein